MYCSKVGIDFQESMVNWGDTPSQLDEVAEWTPWFTRIMTSSKLEPPSKAETDVSVSKILTCQQSEWIAFTVCIVSRSARHMV